MYTFGLFQILIYFILILIITKPLGLYLSIIFNGQVPRFVKWLRPFKRYAYKLISVDESKETSWKEYTTSMLLFSLVGLVFSYLILRLQYFLPLNPQGYGAEQMTPDLAFNTATSFTTNTNWQAYVPETTVSYFSNMAALAIHNWMSAAIGIAIAIAVVRGFSREKSTTIGNFWVDITRATVYVLLPLCIIGGLIYVASGVPQNFNSYQEVTTLEGGKQLIAQGPVASQEIIKQLGTNGGGFFNANSAHPYENPTPFSNLFTIILIFAIPSALTYTFGKMVGNVRQGWVLFTAMSVLFLTGSIICFYFEQEGTPHLASANIQIQQTENQPGGNMEGKETRFGIVSSTLFATVTTAASCGAVNAMHDSFTPLGGLVPLFNILSGEVVFGGVGAGLYGILMFAVLAVFIAGLMVGRTPEYIGKKIQRFEVQMAMLALLITAACILLFTALASNLELPNDSSWNRVALTSTYFGSTTNNFNNSGAHGFSEALYAYASAAGNNGSAFAGITSNTPFYNLTLGLAMLCGRFLMIVPLLAMAGSLAKAKRIPYSSGTFATDNATFVVILVGVILIVGALTYFPALSLGPIVEHFQMNNLVLR